MIDNLRGLSPKQREIRERDRQIMKVAREMFFEQGYFGLTMGKLAQSIGCAKGTVYLHFPCKEDLIVALAEEGHKRRQAMLERAMRFNGRTRERMLAFAYAAELYSRLNPGDVHIWSTITRSLRAKVSEERERSFEETERLAMRYLVAMVQAGVDAGDLEIPEGRSAGEIAFALLSMADGAYRLILSGLSLGEIGISRPYVSLIDSLQRVADSFGWRPLLTEWDYQGALERIRQEVFPEETQRLYDMGACEVT